MNTDDVLKYGHQTVLGTIDGLPEEDWNTPGVCGVWSVKDIIAHLASYERVLVDVLGTLLGDDDTPYLDEFAEGAGFNDRQVAARKDNSVAEVLGEYKDAHTRTMELIEQIPAEVRRQNGTLPWYGAAYDLDDFIAYAFYGHKREHCAQIGVFRDRVRSEI